MRYVSEALHYPSKIVNYISAPVSFVLMYYAQMSCTIMIIRSLIFWYEIFPEEIPEFINHNFVIISLRFILLNNYFMLDIPIHL